VVDGEVYKTFQFAFGEKLTAEAAPEKEGHTFSGWEGLPETMPASDVTVTGTFTVNTYNLIYMVDGEEYKRFEIAYGEKLTAEAAPVKDGYTFSGWQGLPETMPASDVTVTGSFSTNSYTLTYVVDGEVYKTFQFAFGEKLTAEAAPEKEGHTFSGWEGLPETMPASDVTVTGTFTVNTYNLIYIVDGEEYKRFEIAYGEKLTAEAAPEKDGYTFSGWQGLPETMPASDVTVTGSFSTNSYTLTYVVDGEVYKTFQFAFGEKLTAEVAPEKEGHTFSGWEGLPETMPASDVTVTGKFIVNTYNLIYMVDGEEYKRFEIAYGEKLTAEAAPEKEGHTFSGWEGLPETMPASDVTVTGTFTVNTYTLIYMLDGETYKSVQIEYGSKVNPEAAPEKEGHTFSGWEGLPETMPASDITVNGKYAINSYVLTYMVDDEVYVSMEVEYGARITPEDAPEKEGHTFSGWDGLPDTMPSHDVTVNAYYIANYYKLTAYIDGEVYFETELLMGASVEIPEPQFPSGKIFNGWIEEVPETMPAHDVEIHGTTSVFSTLTNIFVDENALLTVYNLKGMLVLKDVTIREASQKLSKGIYIINGKKILIK
ncbi:InlB B-repeat-containing protein, partial [uncultured Duncaniella sp.]|uniref:InlB B-repeat-containing protein n=1 Tax=uncultured Duncaniella sp. TaxID=2768039 RepID=UPI0025A9522C